MDTVIVKQGVGAGFPLVAGYCPACGGSSLFLGAGGHVTCARLDCADPVAADRLLDRENSRAEQDMPEPEPEQTEFWAVYGGQGGRRIAQDLPSREAAEKVKRDFDYRLRDYPMPYTTIERQHGRYGS